MGDNIEQAKDGAIVALLNDAKREGSMAPHPHGTVVVFVHDIEAKGGDLDAVGDWVEDHGGELVRVRGPVSRSLPRRPGKRDAPDAVYFVVPTDALS
jgi:hypothetical protein